MKPRITSAAHVLLSHTVRTWLVAYDLVVQGERRRYVKSFYTWPAAVDFAIERWQYDHRKPSRIVRWDLAC